jgi:two-component SAPR family response regulator
MIFEQNKVFRESLKTALDQIQDFNISFDTESDNYPETIYNEDIQLIIIDSCLGKNKCSEIISKAANIWPRVKHLFMINYKEEISNGFNNVDYILKPSTKKEFEDKIRDLVFIRRLNKQLR